MITERMRHLIDELTALPPEEQDRVAAALDAVLRQPDSSGDAARPLAEQEPAEPNPIFDNVEDFARYLGMTDEEIAESARTWRDAFPPDEDGEDEGEDAESPAPPDHAHV